MTGTTSNRNPDSALIAEVAREVIRRLRGSGVEGARSTVAERLVTVDTLDRYRAAKSIRLADGAVVTPAAREEAARRGIGLDFDATTPVSTAPETQTKPLLEQIARRGISLPDGIEVVWSDQPAKEVYERCSVGRRAVMIAAIADVERFAAEISPEVWVLDKQKLNLVAAANVCVSVARASRQRTGGLS